MITPLAQSRTAQTGVGRSDFTKLPGHADKPTVNVAAIHALCLLRPIRAIVTGAL